ncbi:hypothetical protein D3874_13975 [Oleomonas cavernae]|uniref:Uncharacterized protein n=1 Tax=Oleomonas cavernae TaxID=2320859 RepID=A0A418WDA1_9PROT|nr:hypothetical protein [Oleomonas cavernae]RJF87993.1 hypothetical protein D3874_13975 [Oleomonas cavernae]
MPRKQAEQADKAEVFLNCPFDGAYEPISRAIIFVVMALGYKLRSAREVENSAQSRLAKINSIIRQCHFGIHDISRAGADPASGLARFNMPLELGLFLGAREFGSGRQKEKVALVLDSEPYRYQKFISDLAGSDIQAHGDSPERAIKAVRNWLATNGGRTPIGGEALCDRYQIFHKIDLPLTQKHLSLVDEDMTFTDYVLIVRDWLEAFEPTEQDGPSAT